MPTSVITAVKACFLEISPATGSQTISA